MRILTTAWVGTVFFLAGCGGSRPEPAAEGESPWGTGEIVSYPSEAAFSPTGENSAEGALGNATGFVPIAGNSYSCDSGVKLTVSAGGETDGAATVRLTISGTTIELTNAGAASPDRFTTPQPTPDGQRLTWWSQGGDGLLIESPWRDSSTASETRVSCRRDA